MPNFCTLYGRRIRTDDKEVCLELERHRFTLANGCRPGVCCVCLHGLQLYSDILAFLQPLRKHHGIQIRVPLIYLNSATKNVKTGRSKNNTHDCAFRPKC